MRKRPRNRGFGATLRALRRARGLTLKQVEIASRSLAGDTAAFISHPYLSQIESGHSASVSAPKLMVLAALYGKDIRELIACAASVERARLNRELDEWTTAGRQVPRPVGPFIPADSRRPIDAEIDRHLVRSSRGVAVPLNWAAGAPTLTRSFIVRAALPAYLGLAANDPVGLFWLKNSDLPGRLVASADRRAQFWADAVDKFQEWAVYVHRCGADVAQLVSDWTYDFETYFGSCHFTRPDLEERYGFDPVPTRLVWSVRGRELATRLSESMPSSSPLIPPVPPVAEATRDYFAALFDPVRTSGSLFPLGSVPDGIATVLRIARRVPALTRGGAAPTTGLDSTIGFIQRAMTGAAARRERPGHSRRARSR